MDPHSPHLNISGGSTGEAVVLSFLAVLLASVLFAALLSGPAPAWDDEWEDEWIKERSST
jgi:hypothetical protein